MTRIAFAVLAGALVTFPGVPGQPPLPGVSLPCKVISAHDGDTVTVEVTLRANVRIEDLLCAELNEPGGIAARDFVRERYVGKNGILRVKFGKANDVGDVFSFGRVVGDVYSAEHGWLSEAVIQAGHGKRME